MSKNQDTCLGNEAFITKAELCKFFAVSARTADRWIANGCPKIRIGGAAIGTRSRFQLSRVISWLAERERIETALANR